MKNEVPYQVPNPTDVERHAILRFFLKSDNREEDFHEIIKLLSPPPNIEKIASKEQGKKFKVAIIGAGLSGLCAAYELNKIGCDITIFEASNRIGGRVKTHFLTSPKINMASLVLCAFHPPTKQHGTILMNLNSEPSPL
ncbi:FAD-dependent oxidoreductase [Caloramator sp. Dgby_cultured_2]|uniref:FAD-dependent oxidoreductase n=1 Tax=Caloramator sp. Dgby_cultured_2 TaxID=3029174 RepID=UPI00237D7A8D|nr:FAD-dependent oxidoreductase [Caloramator sp. Dgby_cultured_2]WDU81978.1 FAD-dependent oxidoreductase [Caloramator sp. Dgby_cultured_2]